MAATAAAAADFIVDASDDGENEVDDGSVVLSVLWLLRLRVRSLCAPKYHSRSVPSADRVTASELQGMMQPATTETCCANASRFASVLRGMRAGASGWSGSAMISNSSSTGRWILPWSTMSLRSNEAKLTPGRSGSVLPGAMFFFFFLMLLVLDADDADADADADAVVGVDGVDDDDDVDEDPLVSVAAFAVMSQAVSLPLRV